MTETTIETKRKKNAGRFTGVLLTAGLVGGFGGVAVAAPASATVDQSSFNAGDTVTAVNEIPANDGDPDWTALEEGQTYEVESVDGEFVTVFVGDEGGTRELLQDNFELAEAGGGDNGNGGNGAENGNGGDDFVDEDNGDAPVDDDDAGNGWDDGNGGNGGADIEIDIDDPESIDEEDVDVDVDEEFAEATLTLDVDAVAPGGSVVVNAEGYEPLEDVEFTIDGEVLSTVSADQNGLIEDNVNIPEDTEEAEYVFAGVGLSSGVDANTSLTVISDESGFVEIDEEMGEEVDIESGFIPGDADSAAGLGALLGLGALVAGGGYALHRRQKSQTATDNVQG